LSADTPPPDFQIFSILLSLLRHYFLFSFRFFFAFRRLSFFRFIIARLISLAVYTPFQDFRQPRFHFRRHIELIILPLTLIISAHFQPDTHAITTLLPLR